MDRMKDYKQLLKELPSNTIVCALGEFNPPSIAHELLVKTVKVLSEQKSSDHVIYTSPSKNDLIQEDKKEHYLKLMFPTTKFKSLNESKFASVITELKQKYKNVIVVASTEQLTEINKLKESASVKVICINEKDLEQNHSKMKQNATKGIYEDFKKKLPSAIRDIDGKRLMNDVRHGMGLDPIKEQVVLVKDKLREQYFKGEIFNVGDIVESNGTMFEIVKRGSNHLLLKEESGSLVSKWIQDVKQTEEKEMKEAVIQPNGTDKLEPSTSDTGAKLDPKPTGKTKGFLTFYNYNVKEEVVGEAMSAQVKLQRAFERQQAKTKASVERGKMVMQQAKEKQALADQHTKEKESLQKEAIEFKKKKIDQSEKEVAATGAAMATTFDPFFKEELTEAQIDEIVNLATDDDIEELYEEDELMVVYDDTGEELPVLAEEAQIDLMEVLSRQERMKAKFRLRKTQAKRERTTKISLKRYSDTKTINKRARRLAIKLMKKRILRGRDPAKISVGEKERLEKTLSSRKDVINRVAQKLVSRVRKVEKSRMSHGKATKGSMPSVF